MAGVVAGALIGALLYALDSVVGDGSFMGMRDPRVIDAVVAHARTHAILGELLSLAVLCAACAIFSAIAVALARMWSLARSRRGAIIAGISGALSGHLWMLARSMSQFPALYSAHFYERGGLLRAFMLLVTDHLSRQDLDIGLAIFAVAALGLPLASSRGRDWLRRHRRPIVVTHALTLTALGLWVFTLTRHHRAADLHGRRNLLIIAVDSLRADRLFGADAGRRFPNLFALASRGSRFHEAYVTQARTFPSFVTLLTGRFPAHHGIRHEFPTAAARNAIGPSLPSVLGTAGWRTAALSDFAGEIFSRTPLFDEVDAPRLDLFNIVGEKQLNAHPNLWPYASTRLGRRIFPATGISAELEDPIALADRATEKLDDLSSGPFFLTVFFSAPHTPYAAPSPFWRRFADRDYQGPYRYLKQPLPPLPALPAAEAAQVQALYDGAVASVDDAIGRVLRHLSMSGLGDDTIVVVLGDHGENLFDVPGRGMGHGDHLWGDLANHIPLVIIDPAKAARDIDGIVRDVDLTPTLAALLGVAPPLGDGVDLAPLMTGARTTLDLDAYEESGLWLLSSGPGYRREDRLPYPDLWHATEADATGDIFLAPRWEQPSTDAKVRAVVTPRWKLVYQPTPAETFWRLFDRAADPAERADVAAEHPDVVAELRDKLTRWMQR